MSNLSKSSQTIYQSFLRLFHVLQLDPWRLIFRPCKLWIPMIHTLG